MDGLNVSGGSEPPIPGNIQESRGAEVGFIPPLIHSTITAWLSMTCKPRDMHWGRSPEPFNGATRLETNMEHLGVRSAGAKGHRQRVTDGLGMQGSWKRHKKEMLEFFSFRTWEEGSGWATPECPPATRRLAPSEGADEEVPALQIWEAGDFSLTLDQTT